MKGGFKLDAGQAQELDRRDPLADLRIEFFCPPDTVYLNGNSLGLQSRRAEQNLERVKEEWKTLGIKGWLEGNPPWFWFAEHLAAKLAPLLGAGPREVTVTGSTTGNIHNLLGTFFRPQGQKNMIIMEELAFPTDLYAAQSQLAGKGYAPDEHLLLVPGRQEWTVSEADILGLLDEYSHRLALAFFSSVLFVSGQKLDLGRIAARARELGISAGFDLSHSVGIMPHSLHRDQVDFAVFCNYKWVNGGPGATAGLFVHEKHLPLKPALAGWWGHEKETQFAMRPDFTPAPGAGSFQLGTIDMLSAAPLDGALDLLLEAGIEAVRQKSLSMTGYLMFLVDYLLPGHGFEILTPRDEDRRGGHVAIAHGLEGKRINQALKRRNVVGDFRPPSIIRLAPSPLYNTYQDIWTAVSALREIMEGEEYRDFDEDGGAVT